MKISKPESMMQEHRQHQASQRRDDGQLDKCQRKFGNHLEIGVPS
jgi:hypothetical protein